MPRPPSSAVDERVLVGGGEQRVGRRLAADRGRAFAAGWGASRTSRRRGSGRRAGRRAARGARRAASATAPGRAARSARGRSDRCGRPRRPSATRRRTTPLASAVGEQVGEVLGRVPRRGQRPQREPAEVELVTVADVRRRSATRRRPGRPRSRRRAASSRLPETKSACRWVSTANAIVDAGAVAPPPGTALGSAGRVDDERPAVAEVDQVGGVAETLVDERDRIGCARHLACIPVPCARRRWSIPSGGCQVII